MLQVIVRFIRTSLPIFLPRVVRWLIARHAVKNFSSDHRRWNVRVSFKAIKVYLQGSDSHRFSLLALAAPLVAVFILFFLWPLKNTKKGAIGAPIQDLKILKVKTLMWLCPVHRRNTQKRTLRCLRSFYAGCECFVQHWAFVCSCVCGQQFKRGFAPVWRTGV